MIVDLNKKLPEELANLTPADFEMVQSDGKIMDEKFQTKPIGFFKDAMIRLCRSKVAVISFTMITLIILAALFVPMISGYGYNQQDATKSNLPPKIPVLCELGIADGTRVMKNRRMDNLDNPTRYPNDCIVEVVREFEQKGVKMCDVKIDMYKFSGAAEDQYHLFGTDYLGRDMMTRLFRGTRISLLIAIVSVLTNVVIGVVLGGLAGYYGGKVDMFLTHFASVLSGLPQTVVTILFMLLLGSGITSLILAMCFTGWIGTFRMIRAQFFRYKGREYVLAARTLGVPDRTLIFRHILPNSVGPLITRVMIAIPGAVFSESFLAYIGLGIAPPETSIGLLLADGQKVLLQYPYQTFFPAVLISVLMIAFNMLSNSLRDALDPTKRGEE